MSKVTVFVNGRKNGEFNLFENKTVHEFLSERGIVHFAPCGGNGICKKCKVKCSGELSVPEKSELEFLSDEEILKGVRLSCHAKISGDCSIFLEERDFGLTDFGNILTKTDTKCNGFGISFDIGTTTVAGYLYSLETGKQIDTLSFENRQKSFGDDVISRITACQNPKSFKKINEIIVAQLNEMISVLCEKNGLSADFITDITVAGNTTMLHLLTNLDPTGIAVAPFEPQSLFGTVYRSEQLGIECKCDVFLLPCVSAYVGGDITAGFVACDFDKTDKTEILIDIGTNGEMGLVKDGTIYCCSTAAGPAFEGAHIKYGMSGVPGAISHFTSVGNQNVIEVIGKTKAKGICGSGLIDITAYLLNQGIVDETGYLDGDFEIENTGVFITPKDIREIQLAKSAVCSGVMRLMQIADVSFEQVQNVYLAGGFGTFINPLSATFMGLIPKEFNGKIKAVGNTSGKGASMALISDEARLRIEKVPEKCVYHELSGDREFDDLYIENMMFEE